MRSIIIIAAISARGGESYTHGDFSGLDDLFTEHPRVVQGFIDIYGQWIDDFGIDGFRIDTARHVNPEFWQAFVPAMRERARRRGIENFHIFGEVFDSDIAALGAPYPRRSPSRRAGLCVPGRGDRRRRAQ
ncbi:MAG: alpha-amylase family glycosyl hydrolase [Terricaulis sp.]